MLDTLDRLDARTEEHFVKVRETARKPFRGQVTICVPDPDDPIVRPREENCFRAWGRSLSSSGMSFIHIAPIDVPVVLVGIGGGKTTWFQAQIVRRREMEEFHEFGVAFRGRA